MLMYRWVTLSFNSGAESAKCETSATSGNSNHDMAHYAFRYIYQYNSYNSVFRSVRYDASPHLQKLENIE